MAEEHGDDGGEIREQDRFLPIANIARIMKRSLPENAKIAKDAKECVQECISEFISFISSEASDKCQQEKRKTINGDDLIWAMSTLGFDNYVEPLKVYLSKYREVSSECANKRVAAEERIDAVQQVGHERALSIKGEKPGSKMRGPDGMEAMPTTGYDHSDLGGLEAEAKD
eukprot:scaffold2114_cov253-Pinguiococcus_pyrenoidosus.AAC.19